MYPLTTGGLEGSGWREIGDVNIERAAPSRSIPPERLDIERRARRLAWGGNFWHLIEFALGVGAGIAAGSVALIGFGADSLIEVFSGLVIVWLFSGGRGGSDHAERRAQRLVALSYFVLAAYILAESLRDLIGGHHPQASWVGIALAAVTAAAMPILARAKRRVGTKLGSAATTAEAEQNQLCAYLSAALLVGLLANALLGWWWADPAAAVVIAAIAADEGRPAWSGDEHSCC
jgi:divalent metal cation (Fe/Co/Zn/Cd) transporter